MLKEGKLLIISCLLVISCWGQQVLCGPKKKALVIGNGAYRPLSPLQASVKDAKAIASALEYLGVEVQAHYDLNQKDLVGAIQTFASTVQRGEVVLVYFSGYGMQVENENWLLSLEFDPKSVPSPVNRIDLNKYVASHAYSVQALLSDFDDHQAGARLLMIDANRPSADLATLYSREGLANMEPAASTLIAFAAEPNHVAEDRSGEAIGLFTQALIKALQTPGLTASQLFPTVQSEVVKASKGSQAPNVILSSVNEFCFTPPRPPPKIEPIVIVEKREVTPPLKPGDIRPQNPKDQVNYAWIPKGAFRMGCVPNDKRCLPDEKPQHTVEITKGFWITTTEITVKAYERFTTETKHRLPPKTKVNPHRALTDHPVMAVNWDDAIAYCRWLGGDLPTEAQWEYAARGGKDDQIYPWGNEFRKDLANLFGSKRPEGYKESREVASYPENGFKLFDMIGNAREWTKDVFDADAYKRLSPFIDPDIQSKGKERVIRGGSWDDNEKYSRLSSRDHADPARKPEDFNQTGFRCIVPDLP